jgi:hypothetical protein
MGACSSKSSPVVENITTDTPVTASSLEHRLQHHEAVEDTIPASPDATDDVATAKAATSDDIEASATHEAPEGLTAEECVYIMDLDGLPEVETLGGAPLSEKDEAKRAELSALIFGPPGSPVSPAELEKIDKLVVGGHRNATLLRFLNARGMNVQKAHKMFQDALEWRVDYGTDTMPPVEADPLVVIRKCIPHSWLGFNHDGLLVVVERSGQMDINRLFQELKTADGKPDIDKLIAYHVHVMEYQQRVLLPQESKRRGVLHDKLCVINDLKGLGSHHLTRLTLGTLKKIARIDQDIYAECLGKLFIINAPWIFSAAWTIIKAFLDKRTQEKIFILSGSAEKQCAVLIEQVGPKFVKYDKEKNEIRFLNPLSTEQNPIANKDGNAISGVDGYITPMQAEMDKHFGMGGR